MKQTLKKSLSIILAAAMLICSAPITGLIGLPITDSLSGLFDGFTAKAETATSGTCGENVYWNLDEETGTLTISGNGEIDDVLNHREHPYLENTTPWDRLKIKRVIIEEGITRIGEYVFTDHYNLYDIQIPDSVVSIGVGVFKYCNSLISLTLPDQLTSIPEIMCSLADLRYVYIPASVTVIERAAFFSNPLIEIEFGGTEEQWNNVTIKNQNDFSDVHIVFNGDNTLSESKSGTCGDNVTWELTTDGVLTISGNGHMDSYIKSSEGTDHPWFKYRSKIKKIIISSGILSVGKYAFSDCFNCTSLEIQDGVKTIKEGAFTYLPISSLYLPDSVSSLEKHAFYHCSTLQVVELSDNITVLNESLFEYCENIKSITLPKNLTEIGYSVFYGCDDIEDITIPETVTFIDHNFSPVGTVRFLGAPPSFKESGPPNLILGSDYCYCPPEHYESYKAIFEKWRAKGVLSDGPISAKLNNTYIILDYSKPNFQLTVSDETGNFSSYTETWWLEKPAVASVDQKGLVTASGHGATMLHVEISAGGHRSMANCRVESKRNDHMIALLPENIEADFPVTCTTTSVPYGEVDYVSFQPHKLSETNTSNTYYQELLSLTNDLTSGCSNDNQKARAIFDWVSQNISYGGEIGIGTTADQAYAVYINRKTHCEGFAKLTGFMLYLANIPSCLVASVDHMWNIALLDGKWTMIDSTNKRFDENYNNCDTIEWIGFGTKDLCFVIDNTEGIKLAGVGDHPVSDFRQEYTSLIIPDFVDILFGYSFYNCINLKSVTLPTSIKKISRFAFEECESITDIYYAGSESQWKNIIIEHGNEPLLKANLYFNGESAPHEHSYTSSVTTPATCSKEGVLTYICTECGDSYTEAISKTEHTPAGYWSKVSDPTCTTDGLKIKKCTVCGEAVESQITEANGHSIRGVEWTVKTSATCENAGERVKICKVCGEEAQKEIINPTGHISSTEWLTRKEATCTEDGELYKKCTVCGIDTETQTLSKLGHNFEDEWVTTKNATCTEDGVKTRYCARCEHSITQPIPANGHSDSDWIITEQPDCTNHGLKVKNCTVCGIGTKSDSIPATGHSVGEWEIIKNSDCENTGTKVNRCTTCKDIVLTETIPAKGHTLEAEWKTVTPATCTQNGTTARFCENCEYSLTRDIPATGHNIGEWEIIKKSDCKNTGTKVKRCTICKDIVTTETIPVSGHEGGNWVITKTPQNGNYGIKSKFCIGCGIKIEEKIIYSISYSVIRDSATGIEIVYPEETFEGNVAMNARILSGYELDEKINNEIGKCTYKGYEAVLFHNGGYVTPSKSYSLRLPVPDGMNYRTAEVYAINMNTGNLVKADASYEGGYFLIDKVEAVQYVIVERIVTITLSETNLSLKKGDCVTLYADTDGYSVTFVSSNPSVVTVDINGNVTAVGAGTATITATVDGYNVEAECNVEVTQSFFDSILEAFSNFFKMIAELFGL